MGESLGLDKVIGSSRITRTSFSVSYQADACAFPAAGFLSIITMTDRRRYDIRITDDFREITALSFSISGQHLAVAEKGPNARVFILTFADNQPMKILNTTEIRTKENGLSAVAVCSKSARLVTIGNDSTPFLILWDLKQPKPAPVGYYRLKSPPNDLCISPDGSFALVCGRSMFKFLDLRVPMS
jgi:WD40 repeat protein